ncbi:MAG: class II glutamine amidotransferase [Actinomycetota bacterium]
MCELLGIAVEPAAVMGVYFHAFRPRARQNQSGWGVGWYEGGRAKVVKEAKRADHSEKALELARNQPMSDLFVIHVREATVGEVSLANTHPFTAGLRGREWIWAHNGTVHNRGRLEVGGFTPAGTTDSEMAFYHLLNRLAQLDDDAGSDREAEVILEAGRELSEGSKVNFLLSDGRTLYAYHDGHKTLHFVERSDESGEVRIADDEDYEIELKLPAVAHDRAVIVASVPLTNETWTPMNPGDFLVCRAGRVVDLVRI